MIPETHERIREEDIQETLELFRTGNAVIPPLGTEQHAWLVQALAERRSLCERQFSSGGTTNGTVGTRLRELDAHINSVSPAILAVLHYLSRIRAILPVLEGLKGKIQTEALSETQQHVISMQHDCSEAEVRAAVDGLSDYLVLPRILSER